jgi:hypothetical protein
MVARKNAMEKNIVHFTVVASDTPFEGAINRLETEDEVCLTLNSTSKTLFAFQLMEEHSLNFKVLSIR